MDKKSLNFMKTDFFNIASRTRKGAGAARERDWQESGSAGRAGLAGKRDWRE